MAGLSVGGLNATLGLLVNKDEWARGEAQINHFRRLALGVGAYFGAKWLGGALVGFNRDVEIAKNQIAGMMAYAKKTVITEELDNANQLYDMLRNKAAQLPGETSDYVQMLGLITNPLTRAKATLQEMTDVTAHSFVLAKAFGGTWQEAGRDIRDFLNQGQLYARDKFLRTILNPLGYDANDESRAKLKAMSIEQRLKLLQEAINSPAARSIADRYGNSLQGRIERVTDTLKLTAGKAGEALFGSLKESMTKLAVWLEANQGRIQKWATTAGEYINKAFLGLRDVVLWLVDHKDVLISALVALAGGFTFLGMKALWAWMQAAWPLFAGAGLVYLFLKLRDYVGNVAAAFITLGTAIAAAFAIKRLNDWIGGLKQAATAALALRAAQAGPATAASVVNGAGVGFLGPAGAAQFPERAGPAVKTSTGAGWMAGLGIAGAALYAANVVSDLTGGSFLDQAIAKGYSGDDPLAGLKFLYDAASGNTPAGAVTVNQGPVTINVTSTDAEGAGKDIKSVMEERDAAARAAYRTLTGNRGTE